MLKEDQPKEPIPAPPPALSVTGQVRNILEEAAPNAARKLSALVECEDEAVALRASQAIMNKVIPDKIENPLQFLENYSEDQLIGVIAGAVHVKGVAAKPAPLGVTEKSKSDNRITEKKGSK